MISSEFEDVMANGELAIEIYSSYQADGIALTESQSKELFSFVFEYKKIKKANWQVVCPHDNCTLSEGFWTDCGYGLDRHYDGHRLVCNDCERIICNEIDTVRCPVIENKTLLEIYEIVCKEYTYREVVESIEKLGYHTTTVTPEPVITYHKTQYFVGLNSGLGV